MHCPWLSSSSRSNVFPAYHGAGQAGERVAESCFPRKRWKTAAIIGLAIAGLADSSHAATFLDGAYGSKDGCVYAKTGESSGADDFLLLNDEGITTSVSTCDFKGDVKKTATGFTIKALCEADGEKGGTELATLTRSAKGYTVSFPDGTKLGPMPKCR